MVNSLRFSFAVLETAGAGPVEESCHPVRLAYSSDLRSSLQQMLLTHPGVPVVDDAPLQDLSMLPVSHVHLPFLSPSASATSPVAFALPLMVGAMVAAVA